MITPTPSRPTAVDTPVVAPTRWPLERVLFAMAGTMTLLSAVLTAGLSRWFVLLTAFVGVNQLLYVALRRCPASIVLQRLGVRSQCRW